MTKNVSSPTIALPDGVHNDQINNNIKHLNYIVERIQYSVLL